MLFANKIVKAKPQIEKWFTKHSKSIVRSQQINTNYIRLPRYFCDFNEKNPTIVNQKQEDSEILDLKKESTKNYEFSSYVVYNIEEQEFNQRKIKAYQWQSIAANMTAGTIFFEQGYHPVAMIFVWFTASSIERLRAIIKLGKKIIHRIEVKENLREIQIFYGYSKKEYFIAQIADIQPISIANKTLSNARTLYRDYSLEPESSKNIQGDEDNEIIYFFNIVDEKGNIYDNMILTFKPELFNISNMNLLEDILTQATGEVMKYQYKENSYWEKPKKNSENIE